MKRDEKQTGVWLVQRVNKNREWASATQETRGCSRDVGNTRSIIGMVGWEQER